MIDHTQVLRLLKTLHLHLLLIVQLVEGLLDKLSLVFLLLLLAYQDLLHVANARFAARVGEGDLEIVRFLRRSALQILLRNELGMDLTLANLVWIVKILDLFIWWDDLHVERVSQLLLSFVLLV